jgi:hypothetical protein
MVDLPQALHGMGCDRGRYSWHRYEQQLHLVFKFWTRSQDVAINVHRGSHSHPRARRIQLSHHCGIPYQCSGVLRQI